MPGSAGSSAPNPEPDMAVDPVDPSDMQASPTPTAGPAPTPTAMPPLTPPDSSGTFVPAVAKNYVVPDEWHAVVGDDEIVIAHSSGAARITLREHRVDRSEILSLREIISLGEPDRFIDWSERSLLASRALSDLAHEFSYSGTKRGEPYVATVQWRLRGELLIEVVTEMAAARWSGDSKLRNTAALAAASFNPLPDAALASAVEIEGQLLVRFNQRRSGIFLSSDSRAGRTELTCREVLYDLLSPPVYVGSGVWLVFAVGDQGAQVWQIFEPSLSIVPSAHNTSGC
ncbi:MAG: hypothetical protein O3B04_04640 [Chloroflexi bacterium]|nr:hypothetical protein [Chloroflexota bacterium]